MKLQTFDLRVGKQFILNGMLFGLDRFDGVSRVILKRIETGQVVVYSRNDLADMAMKGTLTDPDLSSVQDCEPPKPFNLTELKEKDRHVLERRLAYVRAVLAVGSMGPKNSRLTRVIQETAERIEDSSPPSPHTVYRWVRSFVHAGYDVAVLAKNLAAKRHRASRLPEGVRELLEKELEEKLAKFETSSLIGIFDEVLENVAREAGFDGYVSKNGDAQLIGAPRIKPLATGADNG